ncbi:group III truncated hemoglobin [Polycladidibacter stylochi]|uniref:group III truncated hemoglobin n=1 Tax=Polycladidibacter stylochi TaxID=1807766 RepID=UPI00082C7B6A|nr:group III truncated hemoglobin [Pseudovibrio stylochi]
MQETLPIRPVGSRAPVDESITIPQINELVDSFYNEIQKHESLGPIFAREIQGDWGPHLLKMKHFWASVLLKTGSYKGKPVPAHYRIQGLTDAHFHQWMDLFYIEVQRIFAASAVPAIMTIAQRIAQSLWLAIFASPFSQPPKQFGSYKLDR